MSAPLDAGDLAGRVFTSRYRRGLLLAPGIGCFAAPLLILPGATLMKSLVAGAAIALATLLVSAWIFTARRRRTPAIVASSEGLRLDGLPLIPWSSVQSARRDPDTRADPALLLRIRPLPAATAGALVSPLWRIVDEDMLRVRIGILEDPPADVEAAVRVFVRRRA